MTDGVPARRIVIRTLGGLLVLSLALGVSRLHDVLVVGVGYQAKMSCSGVFVSKLDPDSVLRDLHADDLAALRYIHTRVDRSHGSATASLLGVTRRAVHRQGLGCALVLDDLAPPALPAEPPGREPAGSPMPWPEGEQGNDAGSPGPIQAVIDRAFEEPDRVHPRRTLAVVIAARGRIVAERYAPGIGAKTPLPGWSMTKSVTSALVGVLVRDGRMAVDAPAPVPEWQHAGDPRGAITMDHLLRMSSGLGFDEGMASPRSDVMQMLFGAGDVGAFAVRKELVRAPGSKWEYSSGTTNVIARVIRNVLGGGVAYLTFPRRALFDPLGMSSAVLETDAAGTFVGSSYMYATARDWARFGLLYLHDGTWSGRRVLPPGWVAYATTPAPADERRRYGAHFWLQVPDQYGGANPGLPMPAFHAVGHEGQFVTVVPSRETVIVRLGRTRYPRSWDHSAFVRDVLIALDPTPAS